MRSAYTAWDASPCNTSARNNVVQAINNVVAGYRANNALPNLHYIVLVGSDEATPMADAPDPVLLSPEEDEASGLAFTTNGGTQGNALYASAAQNQILTDGAYGAFTNIQWLGRSLLLPQLSVSRLVGVAGRHRRPDQPLPEGQRLHGDAAERRGDAEPDERHGHGLRLPRRRIAERRDQPRAPVRRRGRLHVRERRPVDLQPAHHVGGVDGVQGRRRRAADLRRSSVFFQAQGAGTSGHDEPIWPTGLGGTVTVGGITWKAFGPGAPTDAISSVLGVGEPGLDHALNGHYNQYELEAANGRLAATAQATGANLAARILFTMGCHGGLNVADTLPGGNPSNPTGEVPRLAGAVRKAQAAVYIGNTGFGYGDSASVALSERLLALFARNLHSNTDSVGEQWAETLGQYFATAGAYDVYDEKVMEETTFYGLPFWHFGTAPVTPLSSALSSLKGKGRGPSSIDPSSRARRSRRRTTRTWAARRARRQLPGRGRTRRSRSSGSTGRSCRSRARRSPRAPARRPGPGSSRSRRTTRRT